MPGTGHSLELARVEVMIANAEAELAALRIRLERAGRPHGGTSDPFDPLGCLERWLAALRARRDELLGEDAAAPSGPSRPR